MRSVFWQTLPATYTAWLLVAVIQSPRRVWLSEIPWTAARQASLSLTISCSLLKFRSIELVMPSNHLILCLPLLLLPSVFPSIRIFSNELAFRIRWPKYWSFSFSTSTSNEYSGLISFRIDCFDLLTVQGTLKSLLQHHKLSLAPPEMKMCECWELILLTCYRFTFSWKSNWEILFLVTNNGHCNQNLLLLEWHQKLPWDL